MAKKSDSKTVESISHKGEKRKNIPTAEHRSLLRPEDLTPVQVAYTRRNPDLDPQLVWRGKDLLDDPDLVVQAPPLYIQEKIHPKALIDDLMRQTQAAREGRYGHQLDLFADFNGLPSEEAKTEFYQHDQNWSNRMILGDSLLVMASLAEREGLRGKVQCIYIDPPYGIKFNSNFQWSTTSRDVKDGKAEHITREPEQVKAFRDTWRDGIHSYLSYLRDRLIVARDLLTESGSIFVQIGDENVHRVRAVMDEIFGDDNCVGTIVFAKTSSSTGDFLGPTYDSLLWYSRNKRSVKYSKVLRKKVPGQKGGTGYRSVELPDLSRRGLTNEEMEDPALLEEGSRIYFRDNITSQSVGREKGEGAASWFPVNLLGRQYKPSMSVRWKTNELGFERLIKANRVEASSGENLGYIRYLDDYPVFELTDVWTDTLGQNQFGGKKTYVVQTALSVVERCILMTTRPGDLVLDPTCGSGTTAYVAEQWGRRWITIDTSRVALALARARIMGARYPYYLLADSPEGQRKEAELSGREYVEKPTYGDVRQGFVYERVPHITLESIANNAEIDVIWEEWQPRVQAALDALNRTLRGHKRPYKVTTGGREGKEVRFDAPDGILVKLPSGEEAKVYELLEWEVPREAPQDWPEGAKEALKAFWEARIGRQRAIDASIAAKAEYEYLYDKPYVDNKKVRVAGPFTVESLSPYRTLAVDENDELIDPQQSLGGEQDFVQMVLENLKAAGVQQAKKEDRISFTSLIPWPGEYVCAEGRYLEGETERRAAIFVGPEFGTVSRPDLVVAAREAGDAGFDVLIACAFNFEAQATEFGRLGRVPVLKARMNADLHMGGELKSTGKGNLFVIFGEPSVRIEEVEGGKVRVVLEGVDVYDPNSGEIRSDNADGIACWFIDTDYNEESFFVRHAYFLGQNDPYGALKTSLRAEIDAEAWASLNSDTSRPFEWPKSGRIAVKVINHLGDEVMKVFRV
ncbi:site-specific DNA-methyltransferase [Meiothermus sp.]|jgi:adenine-specific DNA-methyltransferase|uniref:site-specific DNA-methyltransferase n=1 Tax=Meiothermus sp. TaxID=1955249 RepID=UPI00307E34F7